MIHKSEYIKKIDQYLNEELFQSELIEFENQVEVDFDLFDEYNLHLDVSQSVCELDVMELRKSLNQIIFKNAESECLKKSDSFNFDLFEELATYDNLSGQVSYESIINHNHSFPKIHLYQHSISVKENIHQFYKEQLDSSLLSEEESFTSHEEAIFNDVQTAMEEVDILDLRANIKQISHNIPVHQYSLEDIDDYLLNQMDSGFRIQFEEELSCNISLSQDVQLMKELDLAWGESDILDLRASLIEIQKQEQQKFSKIEEIEGYIYKELSDDDMALFEVELCSNRDLLTEVDLVRNIDMALKEVDVMQLRGNLQNLAGKIIIDSKRERSFVTKYRLRKLVVSSVAASLILLLGIAGLLTRGSSEGELYQKFYSSYPVCGISRSLTINTDKSLSLALQAFDNKDYVSALSLFDEALSRDHDNVVGRFYSGVSYQETREYQRAITEYKYVIQNKDNLFVDQAEWFIGLCYLQASETKEAYKYFTKISRGGGFYQQKAQEILHKIQYSD